MKAPSLRPTEGSYLNYQFSSMQTATIKSLNRFSRYFHIPEMDKNKWLPLLRLNAGMKDYETQPKEEKSDPSQSV